MRFFVSSASKTPLYIPSQQSSPFTVHSLIAVAGCQPHYISPTPGKFPIIASSPVSDNRIPTRAEEIDYDYTADSLYYKILGDSEKCVEVVNGNRETAPETIIIPPIVKIDGREYTVIGLGHRVLVIYCLQRTSISGSSRLALRYPRMAVVDLLQKFQDNSGPLHR